MIRSQNCFTRFWAMFFVAPLTNVTGLSLYYQLYLVEIFHLKFKTKFGHYICMVWFKWYCNCAYYIISRAVTIRIATYKYALSTRREVKIAGYWPSSLFAFLSTEAKSWSIENAKRERGQYPAILTKLAWSIKDLFYGTKNTEKMIFTLVYFRALKRKPVICKNDVLFSLFSFSLTLAVFSFSGPIPDQNSHHFRLSKPTTCPLCWCKQ